MSADPEQEFFADGIAEDVITALSRYPSLFVIARNSSFTYKGRAVDIKQIGRELGVRYVLEGSLRKAGNRIRVTAQLVEGVTGKHVWAERYDTRLDRTRRETGLGRWKDAARVKPSRTRPRLA
jgi:adenylate cyclase